MCPLHLERVGVLTFRIYGSTGPELCTQPLYGHVYLCLDSAYYRLCFYLPYMVFSTKLLYVPMTIWFPCLPVRSTMHGNILDLMSYSECSWLLLIRRVGLLLIVLWLTCDCFIRLLMHSSLLYIRQSVCSFALQSFAH